MIGINRGHPHKPFVAAKSQTDVCGFMDMVYTSEILIKAKA